MRAPPLRPRAPPAPAAHPPSPRRSHQQGRNGLLPKKEEAKVVDVMTQARARSPAGGRRPRRTDTRPASPRRPSPAPTTSSRSRSPTSSTPSCASTTASATSRSRPSSSARPRATSSRTSSEGSAAAAPDACRRVAPAHRTTGAAASIARTRAHPASPGLLHRCAIPRQCHQPLTSPSAHQPPPRCEQVPPTYRRPAARRQN